MSMRSSLVVLGVLVVVVLSGARAPADVVATGAERQVLVTLAHAPLAYARDRASARAEVATEQGRFVSALRRAVPSATIRRRYRLVVNGFAVVVPASSAGKIAALPGVTDVSPVGTYSVARTTASPALVQHALAAVPGLTGDGVKIGIIDDGVDQTHPFFDPKGFTMPAGFPKGNRAFTTAKVIVARAFAPAGTTYAGARLPFDDNASFHATHVAGIAAGDADTLANGKRISGLAPRAWLGNYKALGIPTDAGVGLDGNSPELVAAIEAAVADGMDVINLSLGEPEIEPDRDIVARALDAAAAAGVVPVVAAGNDYDELGPGSLSSPGSAQDAITVAALQSTQPPELAGFSSSGPTPISLRLKPDVAAPGVGVVSSVPGGWDALSGTSMATPYVSGVSALLLQEHPDWSVETIKGALVGTARPVRDGDAPALPVRGGAGLVDPVAAGTPLVVASPTSLSFGLLADGATTSVDVDLADVGGGLGLWDVAVDQARGTPVVTTPASVTVPGVLTVSVAVPASAADGDVTGTITLRRGTTVRRIPYWGRLETPLLASSPARTLRAPGLVQGSTAGRASVVAVYRYPEVPAGGPVTSRLFGPEQLFTVTVSRRIANFGVVIVGRGKGVRVEPRVVEAADENRLTGYAALPFVLNPYLEGFGGPVLAAGAIDPAPGTYTVVFDSATAAGAGAFTFRYWVDDRTPPSVRLLTPSVQRGASARVRLSDAGSGVDPASIVVRVDGREVAVSATADRIAIPTAKLTRGRHVVRIQVSDYQETRNMENVARILPNTRVLGTTLRVR